MGIKLKGLRTVVYPTDDLDASKNSWSDTLGIEPYFDEPFYVGFDVGGYEMALDPDGDIQDGPIVYWGVDDIAAAHDQLLSNGATGISGIGEVGGGIFVAVVALPDGTKFGIIENPHFAPR